MSCCATQGHVWQVDGTLQLFHPDVELVKAKEIGLKSLQSDSIS